MKGVLLVFLMAIATVSFGQISNVSDVTGRPLTTGSESKVEGSPYLNGGSWFAGEVTDVNGDTHIKRLRYNALEDRLEYFENSNTYYYENNDIKSFDFSSVDEYGNEVKYSFASKIDNAPGVDPSKYYRVIYNGNTIKILEWVRVVKIKVTPNAYGEEPYDKYVFDNKVLIYDGKSLEKFRITKGAFYKTFPSKKKEIKNLISKENLGVIDENDAVIICEMIESSLGS